MQFTHKNEAFCIVAQMQIGNAVMADVDKGFEMALQLQEEQGSSLSLSADGSGVSANRL